MVRQFSFGVCVVLATLLLAPVVFSQPITPDLKPVKIGMIVPLTGGLAARGDDIAKLTPVLKAHLDAANLTHDYEFIVEDGKCGAGNVTTTATNKLINIDHVKFLLTACSGETLQAGPIAEKNKVITFAVLSLHPAIKKLGDYIFRTFIDVEKSIQGFADYMDSQCDGKIAILTEENAFTFGIRDLLLKRLGEKVVFAQDFPADSSDFGTLLAKLNHSGAKGIYLNAMSEGTLANLVNQAKRLKLDQTLFSYNMPETASFRAATGKNGENLYFIGTPAIKNSSAEFMTVLAEFSKRNPGGPSDEFTLRTTFDAVKSIVDAVEAVGPDTAKVKDFLYTYSAKGALGEVKFDSNGDIKNLHYVLKRTISDNKVEIVADLVKPE